MKLICELLTSDPEGGAARIQFSQFQDFYKYLAKIDGEISQGKVSDVLKYLQNEA